MKIVDERGWEEIWWNVRNGLSWEKGWGEGVG